jgi:hypothetical protein
VIAAAGIACGLIALWVNAFQGKYWEDGTFGGLILILSIVAGLLLLAAMATNQPMYDVAAGAVGGVILGMYLWTPALLAFDHWDDLDPGAWIGVCSALIVIGAAIALGPALLTAVRQPAPLGALLAVVGLALVLVGIWTKAADGLGKYWNVPTLGHSLGILMLILVVLTALAIGAAFAGVLSQDVALGLAEDLLGPRQGGLILAVFRGEALDAFDIHLHEFVNRR